MPEYIRPNKVTSPRKSWSLIEVLDDKGEGAPALALGRWEGNPVVGIRWNGRSEEGKTLGNPQSRALSTWFILPSWAVWGVLRTAGLDEKKLALVRNFIEEPKI